MVKSVEPQREKNPQNIAYVSMQPLKMRIVDSVSQPDFDVLFFMPFNKIFTRDTTGCKVTFNIKEI